MKTIKAFIERGDDGTYGVYIDLKDNSLNYGIFGDGKTAKEAIDDFNNSYIEMKKFHEDNRKKFVEAKFDFIYDLASFLSYYSNILSLSGLEKLTGVSQGQLSHYVTGHRKPSIKTTKKIEIKLKEFGSELHHIDLV
jgi:hypothetical protein